MFIRLVEYERKYLSWLIEAGRRVGIYMDTDDGLFYTTVDPERQKCAFIIKPKKKCGKPERVFMPINPVMEKRPGGMF